MSILAAKELLFRIPVCRIILPEFVEIRRVQASPERAVTGSKSRITWRGAYKNTNLDI